MRRAEAESRLKEAEWWFRHIVDPWAFSDSQVGKGAAKRLEWLRIRLVESRSKKRRK